MEDNPTPPSKDGLEKLVELMGENNRATSEIERDGRNTRRHLLEMKKIQQASLDMSDRVNTGFDNFFETMNANKLGDEEKANERSSIFEEIRDELREMRSSGIPQEGGSSSSGGGSGGFMKMLGGAGLGVGAAAVGVAAVFASSAFLIKTIENMDGKKIVQNVDDLLGISRLEADEFAAAEVFATLATIGAGLLIFSAGSSAAALSQGVIDKFEGGGWPEKIKHNVAELLSIADLEGMSVGNVAGVSATMAALGLGLLAFSAGSATGAAVTGVDEAVKSFSGNDGFAKSIKDNVETLLSIDTTSASGLGSIVGTMAALSLGLIAFSIGSATAVAAEGAGAAIEKFSGDGNWAENIVDNISTLLGIADLSFGDVLKTTGALGTLGTGLAAFGVGSFFAGVGDSASSADSIVSEVNKLLTIGETADKERTLAATGALASLGFGLAQFAAGKGVNALADLGASIVSFFTGTKSPIEQAIEVGEKADTIQAGADAFSSFADVFERMSSMGEISIEMGSAITDLDDNVRLLETILQGGTLTRGFNFETDGLANLGDDVDKAVANFNRIQGILNMNTSDGTTAAATSDNTGIDLMNISAENVELRSAVGQQGPVNMATDNSTQSSVQANTTNILVTKPNRTQESTTTR